jgi:hypothetical protein
MTPGPTEPTAEQLQHQLKLIIDDLLNLYENGILVKTPLFPQGRLCYVISQTHQLSRVFYHAGHRVCVVCMRIVCDHPAAVKMCGCADKSHNAAPCTRCTVTQVGLFSDQSLRNGECQMHLPSSMSLTYFSSLT